MQDSPDIKAIIGLVDRISLLGRRTKGKPTQIRISLSTFVPKPHTPFQWAAQESEQQLSAKHELLKQGLRRKEVRLSWHDPEVSLLEAALSRGDRRLGRVIYRAWQKGSVFDGWSEHFNYQNWLSAFSEAGLDLTFYAQRQRPLDEHLPWAHIDVGIRESFLKQEYGYAQESRVTSDCRIQDCNACGLERRQDVCQQKYRHISQKRR